MSPEELKKKEERRKTALREQLRKELPEIGENPKYDVLFEKAWYYGHSNAAGVRRALLDLIELTR